MQKSPETDASCVAAMLVLFSRFFWSLLLLLLLVLLSLCCDGEHEGVTP